MLDWIQNLIWIHIYYYLAFAFTIVSIWKIFGVFTLSMNYNFSIVLHVITRTNRSKNLLIMLAKFIRKQLIIFWTLKILVMWFVPGERVAYDRTLIDFVFDFPALSVEAICKRWETCNWNVWFLFWKKIPPNWIL